MALYFVANLCAIVILLCIKQFYEVSALVFINDCFLLGLTLLMLGAAIFVHRTGFFRSFFRGFQQLYRWIVPKPKMLIREEEKWTNGVQLDAWKSQVINRMKLVFLGMGTGCLFVSFIYLFLYY
ncbi:DUF3899 domain-containing protein [Geobacillus sp. YHL]|uniref:DUF3899 domain-containing protein n=1 Tax=Geobacillus sp. YHL TaxID=2796117 RepID=UPI001EEFBCF7|nr:DUF3899 domain-containing protein [Geobacillus sp. YHL]MCG6795692.1 DUF3899 domain-containing protein [Geobacillus sp. YHL]